MPRPKIDLKDPALAALLAFLVPGLGHFYQRRIFKGALYCVCILGTFFTGLSIGHGQVVYFQWKQPENRTYAYLCQFWAGLPALPALAQSQLRSKSAYDTDSVLESVSAEFEGTLFDSLNRDSDALGKLSGTVQLTTPDPDHRPARQWIALVSGTFTPDGGAARPIKGEILPEERGKLDPVVAPWPQRKFAGRFVETGTDQPQESVNGRFEGGIPRRLLDRFEAPLQDSRPDFGTDATDLDRAHRDLGGRFELGVVYTMIAGLLNILAIFDAFEGPAYEDEEEAEDEAKSDKSSTEPPPSPPA